MTDPGPSTDVIAFTRWPLRIGVCLVLLGSSVLVFGAAALDAETPRAISRVAGGAMGAVGFAVAGLATLVRVMNRSPREDEPRV